MRKQEVILRNPSGTIKLVLWEQYVDLLVPSQTYNLENLKVKVYNDQRYLNTPRDEEFNATKQTHSNNFCLNLSKLLIHLLLLVQYLV